MKCEFISEIEGRFTLKILKTTTTQVPADLYSLQQGTGKYRLTRILYNRGTSKCRLTRNFTTGYE